MVKVKIPYAFGIPCIVKGDSSALTLIFEKKEERLSIKRHLEMIKKHSQNAEDGGPCLFNIGPCKEEGGKYHLIIEGDNTKKVAGKTFIQDCLGRLKSSGAFLEVKAFNQKDEQRFSQPKLKHC